MEFFLFILCWDFDITKKSEGQEDNQEDTDSAVLKTRHLNPSNFNMKLLTSPKPCMDIILHFLSSQYAFDKNNHII